MSYITPRLIGRLGNNFFQIAAAIGYAKKHNCYWGIKKGYIEKGFKANQVDKFLPHLPACESYFKNYSEWQEEWTGKEFNYHEIPYKPNGVEIVGFWQSYKYFENAEEEVRKWLKLDFIEGYRDYVSIHVRRGDYAQLADNFPPVTTEYIKKATDTLLDKMLVSTINHIMVFSDDIEWCKREIPKMYNPEAWPKFEFSEGRNEWEDLCLMASCGHNIIANSSFSWWAAWLNTNQDKIVISPSHKWGNWFGLNNGVKHDCVDLLPPEWIQIEFRTIKQA
jgi:hypothetical protein